MPVVRLAPPSIMAVVGAYFISHRLRELGRDAEAEVFESLQSRTPKRDEVEHMVFTVSGNDPTPHFQKAHGTDAAVTRHLVGCVIPDHQAFIGQLFDDIYAGKRE